MALGGDGLALGMGLHHDVYGPLYGHAGDDFLQHGDDVLHRRVVVVVQDDLVGGLLGDAGLYLDPRLRLGGGGHYAMQRWYASHCHLRQNTATAPDSQPLIFYRILDRTLSSTSSTLRWLRLAIRAARGPCG